MGGKYKDADFTDTIMPNDEEFTKAETPSDNQQKIETITPNLVERQNNQNRQSTRSSYIMSG
ncbi:MAG: hypothetical protein F6K23_06055 [Okeania sp. SIO2C9]|uniref:hypothetical protein n=1 Tax=Okeania sp. SIO2C9 TaxID=2607791 RepID=UPI0013BECD18|nr:hypothetical protein [Okeania sp. SIO2C9]NEQ72670.1 hypothetical protein [Okeania sp. SIO2C9]